MKLQWKKYQLNLKETFSIAYGKYNHRDSLILTLTFEDQTGFGECVAIDYYQINLDDFIKKLYEIQALIEVITMIHPEEFYQFLKKLHLHHFLQSALDCAYWDLYGKIKNKSFSAINDLKTNTLPKTSYTISIATIPQQIEKIKQSEWGFFKVKCNGLPNEAVFQLFESGKKIALDSNTSFTENDCDFLQENTKTKEFLYLEQPLPIGNYQILKNNKNANWMADEDCQNIEDLEKLGVHYSSINVKLMKCGGLTAALPLIKKAKELQFQVMIGCMTESSIGISAGIAVASLCDFADLDGASLISNDPAKGSFIENGNIILSEKPGLGISWT